MGKHPGHLISSLPSSSSSSAKSNSKGMFLTDILDQRFATSKNQVPHRVHLIAKLAFACLRASPQSAMMNIVGATQSGLPAGSTPMMKLVLESRKLAFTMEVNEKCDVSSFGVLALEVIMMKHPSNLISSLPSSSLSESNMQGMFLKDILDQSLPTSTNQVAR
ncbi:hypothetical protein ACSBR1_001058 [Camellia fascicularis]